MLLTSWLNFYYLTDPDKLLRGNRIPNKDHLSNSFGYYLTIKMSFFYKQPPNEQLALEASKS